MANKKWAVLDAISLAYFDRIIRCLIEEDEFPKELPMELENMMRDAINNSIKDHEKFTTILNRVFKPLVEPQSYYPHEDLVIYLYKNLKKKLSDEEKKMFKACNDNKIIETQLKVLEKFSEVLKCRIELFYIEGKGVAMKSYGNSEKVLRVLMLAPEDKYPLLHILYDANEFQVHLRTSLTS
eukprot:TRINITY_DN2333_c0_g1_i4.p1 TRINITY_DN2333_c0_g1~~TRINITY_DN2333_c0_g1_i4.p1  ORF type:complete len:182 (+),score=29.16 TRINITY_DN2333_c0_g1_i4:286-831(+)